MANYENNQNLHIIVVNKNKVDKTALIPVFDIDSDFSENEDYFREDTLALGYKSESERCAEEVYESCKEIQDPVERLDKMLKLVPEYSNGEQSFIVGNSNHSGDYAIELTEIGDKIVLAIAFIG